MFVCVASELNGFEQGPRSEQDWSGGASASSRVSRPAYCGRYGLSVFQDEIGPPAGQAFIDGISFGTGVFKDG